MVSKASNWREDLKSTDQATRDNPDAQAHAASAPKPLGTDDARTQYPLSVTIDSLNYVRQVAHDEHRSVQSCLRDAVGQWIDRHERLQERRKKAGKKKGARRA